MENKAVLNKLKTIKKPTSTSGNFFEKMAF